MGESLGICQRKPPPGWPGDPCSKPAHFEVRYLIAIAPQPRRIKVCLEHLQEMHMAQEMGALRDIEVLAATHV